MAAASARSEGGTGAAAGLAVAPSLEAIREAFPEMEIVGMLGSGGMGVVYKARQKRLDRWVALKILAQQFASQPAFVERFEREAKVLARLNHPNIVTLYDFGQSGGFCYLVMEYVDGVNLAQAMRAGRFTPSQALAVVPKICDALQYAHELGVLHRDIKPANLLLDERGRVKIADFGVAKLLGNEQRDVTLTESGAAVGTPAYMAPEQIERPGEVDHRADIYSLGVVFYEMLTGELPLGRFSAPSEKNAMDHRIDEVVMRALKKERELRQQTAGEVKTQIEGITAGPQMGAAADSRNAAGGIQGKRSRMGLGVILGIVGGVAALALAFPVAVYFWLAISRVEIEPQATPVHGSEVLPENSGPQGRGVGILSTDGDARTNRPALSERDRQRIEVKLALAETHLTETRKRFEAGVVSTRTLATAQRDVDVLRAKLVGDAVAEAEVELRFAEMVLEETRTRVQSGQGSKEEERQAEAEAKLRRIDLEEVKRR